MAWRNQGITGSNNIPLGNRRRFGGSDAPLDDGGYNPSQPLAGLSDGKRGRSPERGKQFYASICIQCICSLHDSRTCRGR